MLDEQRVSRRKPIAMSVTLDSGNKEKRPCKVRDLSLNGAFVECEHEDLSKDNKVELSISFDEGKGPMQHSVPARVTRVSEDGAALSFRSVDMDTFGSILELLYVHK